MTAVLKVFIFFIAFGFLLCGCRTVSHLPQYEKFIGRESLLDRDYYLYEEDHWPSKGYVLRREQLPTDPAYGKTTYKFITTLQAGTAVTVVKAHRIYIEDGCDELYAEVYVPTLKDTITFRYTVGHLPQINDGTQKLDWMPRDY